jgi:hypothetical protein
MPLSVDASKKRLGLAVAAAVAAAIAATVAFDRFEDERTSERAQPPSVVPDAARSPGVLDRVPVRRSGAPGIDDVPTEALVAEPPPSEEDVLLQPEPSPDDEVSSQAEPPHGTAVVTAPPNPPAAPPAEPEQPEPAVPDAAPSEDIARTADAVPDAELARRFNREGIALINAGRPAQAIAPLERAASLQPRDAEILDNLGYAYLLVGERLVASRYFMRALDYAPTRSATWINLGHAYAELGQRERAVHAVVTGYRHSTSKATLRAALLATATGSQHSPQWREAAGLALARIDDG